MRPLAVYEMFIIWNRQFSDSIARILEAVKYINLRVMALLILAVTLILRYILSRKVGFSSRLPILYSIATTGFFGMLASLVLIFSFQVAYGYLYYAIGVLISIFMAGAGIGSILLSRSIIEPKKSLRIFIRIDFLILFFALILVFLLPALIRHALDLQLVFAALFLILGALVGAQFAAASKIYAPDQMRIGETAGKLYAADLLGGWLAGILGGVFLLPLMGLSQTCLILACLKISSLALIL